MRRACLTLSVLAVALIGPSSARAAAWLTPPQPISAAGSPAASPPLDVAVDPAKDVFIAWERPAVVQVGVRPAGGMFGVASLYGCPFGFFCTSAHQPDIAVDASGNSIVVFTLDGRLKAFMRPAGGSYTELPAITSATNAQTPKVGFAPDGTAIAVWQQDNAGLFAAERPPGGSFGTPIPIFTEAGGEEVSSGSYELATGGTGHAIVAFETDMTAGNGTTVRIKTVFRAPVGWGAPQQVSQESASSDGECTRSVGVSKPAVALDAAANAVIAFQVQKTSFGGMCLEPTNPQTKVVADRRMVALGTWGAPPTTFDDSFSGFNFAPATAFTSSGEALVAWARSEGATTVIRQAAGPAGGPTFGGAGDVPGSALTDSNATLGDPGLVPLPGGAAMLGFLHQSLTDPSVEYALRPGGGSFGAASTAADVTVVPNDLKLAVTPAGDVGATWLEEVNASEARVYSLIYDASPPSFGDVTVPATGVVGQALAMSATATDAFSPVTFGWAFGDGATASGAATSHAYGATGSFDVTVTATDAAANSSTATRTTEIAVDPSPEFLGRIVLANARLRAAARGASAIPAQRRRRRAPIGTRVTFRLSEAASVRFTVERARPGRRVRGRCVKPTRRNRTRRKCTRYVRQRGSFTVAAGAGETRFRFTGRLRGRKLRPGRYRLVAVATDDTGKRSAPKRARFTIVR
jgi:hypothetical protein